MTTNRHDDDEKIHIDFYSDGEAEVNIIRESHCKFYVTLDENDIILIKEIAKKYNLSTSELCSHWIRMYSSDINLEADALKPKGAKRKRLYIYSSSWLNKELRERAKSLGYGSRSQYVAGIIEFALFIHQLSGRKINIRFIE
jgi:hypothetical protein